MGIWSMWISPNIKDKKAQRFAEALAPQLADGETLEALLQAISFKPSVDAIAVTSTRVIAMSYSDVRRPERLAAANFVFGRTPPVRASSPPQSTRPRSQPTARANARHAVAAAAADAAAAFEDTDAIERALAEQHRVAEHQRPAAPADRDALNALDKPALLRHGAIAHRSLAGKLTAELAQYDNLAFNPGERPEITAILERRESRT